MKATIHYTSGKKTKLDTAQTKIFLQMTEGGRVMREQSTLHLHDGAFPTLSIRTNGITHVTYRKGLLER